MFTCLSIFYDTIHDSRFRDFTIYDLRFNNYARDIMSSMYCSKEEGLSQSRVRKYSFLHINLPTKSACINSKPLVYITYGPKA